MAKLALAELLLRRKELNDKLAGLQPIRNAKDLFEIRIQRIKVTEDTDNVTANVPKLSLGQFTVEYDHYARQLRQIDGLIQRTNWETEVDTKELDVISDWVPPKEEEEKAA